VQQKVFEEEEEEKEKENWCCFSTSAGEPVCPGCKPTKVAFPHSRHAQS
jgi:hypothetical protein